MHSSAEDGVTVRKTKEKKGLHLMKKKLTCPYCGKKIQPDDMFCPRCGKEL